MTDTKYTISKPYDTGTYQSTVYHLRRDCERLNQSKPEYITAVSDRDIDRYNLRECPDCGRKRAESLLDKVGVST